MATEVLWNPQRAKDHAPGAFAGRNDVEQGPQHRSLFPEGGTLVVKESAMLQWRKYWRQYEIQFNMKLNRFD